MREMIHSFCERIKEDEIEIYNEFSLQHELGIFLRRSLPKLLVQFERNVSYFGFSKGNFKKKEMDISIFDRKSASPDLHCAIELKFPRNGQYPEQMYSFCKDIVFLEQLRKAGFQKACLVIFADDYGFYEGQGEGIYGYFRKGVPLHGTIEKPTGSKSHEVHISGTYEVKWNQVKNSLFYSVIETDVAR